MIIEGTITYGQIFEIGSILLGGFAVLITLRNTVSNIKSDVAGMQLEIKKLSDVITKMAVTDVRLTNLEVDVRELRHGRGFVREAIDGEYTR